MLVEKLDSLYTAKKVIDNNKDINIAYAIKDSKGEIVTCNQFFLECTGIKSIKDIQGLSDRNIELWKDARYDYAIGEQIAIKTRSYYLSVENLPLRDIKKNKSILTEKMPFYDNGNNYILDV